MQPVRSVPFFNLYDDIQITHFTSEYDPPAIGERWAATSSVRATQRQLAPLQAAVWPDSRARTVPPQPPLLPSP